MSTDTVETEESKARSGPAPSVEIDPQTALAEDAGAPPVSETVDEEEVDVLDVLVPKAGAVQWELDDKKGNVRQYVQRPLSYFDKMTFFGLVGEVIDKAMSGEQGLKLGNLLDVPDRGAGALSADDFRDADTFVQAVGKLVAYMPDFLQKCYCIWWKVPEYEREWAIDVMSRQPEEGGLTDEKGLEVIEVFIDQNWDALEDFFGKHLPQVGKRVQSHRKAEADDSESPQLKPSNDTQDRTLSP